ncbi:unnamed protein product [Tilletia controversa]|uniref:Uncharacterized protein n=3 Tax=Tilletia TaxID=13289 RepID=A0A8X7MU95_9BASI|nr:hypothetical protein CF336_g3025 [Tilletia laevis]KAE8201201.1 hypothetical protein CF328_g2747 [Tilletia controversa]KAE8263328.1 hypothetical protein A4X03_0g1763 [Tilletia caries]KAE8206295.1 hypothetical protein CF335_g2005 [Tilletia laevis]KAE8248663.1 hypothetical protein A4X06_0g3584 [Tilletia controversa]
MRALLRRVQHSPSTQAQAQVQVQSPSAGPDTASGSGSGPGSGSASTGGILLGTPSAPGTDRPRSPYALASPNHCHGAAGIGYTPSPSPSPSPASPLDDPPAERSSLSRQGSNNNNADDDRRPNRPRRSIGLLHTVINNTNGLSIPGSGSSSSSLASHSTSQRRGSQYSHDADWTDPSYDADVDGAPSYYEQALKRGLLSPQQLKDGPAHVSPNSKSLSPYPPSAASAMASRELRKGSIASPKRAAAAAAAAALASSQSPTASINNAYIPIGSGGRVRSQVEEWEASSRPGSEHGHASNSSHHQNNHYFVLEGRPRAGTHGASSNADPGNSKIVTNSNSNSDSSRAVRATTSSQSLSTGNPSSGFNSAIGTLRAKGRRAKELLVGMNAPSSASNSWNDLGAASSSSGSGNNSSRTRSPVRLMSSTTTPSGSSSNPTTTRPERADRQRKPPSSYQDPYQSSSTNSPMARRQTYDDRLNSSASTSTGTLMMMSGSGKPSIADTISPFTSPSLSRASSFLRPPTTTTTSQDDPSSTTMTMAALEERPLPPTPGSYSALINGPGPGPNPHTSPRLRPSRSNLSTSTAGPSAGATAEGEVTPRNSYIAASSAASSNSGHQQQRAGFESRRGSGTSTERAHMVMVQPTGGKGRNVNPGSAGSAVPAARAGGGPNAEVGATLAVPDNLYGGGGAGGSHSRPVSIASSNVFSSHSPHPRSPARSPANSVVGLPPSSSSSQQQQQQQQHSAYEHGTSVARGMNDVDGTPRTSSAQGGGGGGERERGTKLEDDRSRYASDAYGRSHANGSRPLSPTGGGGHGDPHTLIGARRGSAASLSTGGAGPGGHSFPYIPPALTSPPPKEPLPPPPPGASRNPTRRASGSGSALSASGRMSPNRRHSHHPRSPSSGSVSSGWPGQYGGGGGASSYAGPSAYSFSLSQNQNQNQNQNGGNNMGKSASSRFGAQSSTFSTQSLAAQLNELAVAFADGLLDPDEYRILRQGIFDRMSSDLVMAVPETTAIKGMAGSRVSIDGAGGGGAGGQGFAGGLGAHQGFHRGAADSTVSSSGLGENGLIDDSESSSIYESAHSHRSGGAGGGGGYPGRGSGAQSSMSVAANSLLSSVVAAASIFRGRGAHSHDGPGSGSGSGSGNRTHDSGLQEQLSDGSGQQDMLSSGRESSGRESIVSMAMPVSPNMMNAHRARSGSGAGSMFAYGGRTSAASSNSRPSVLGSQMFMAPSAYYNHSNLGGSESHSLQGGAGTGSMSASAMGSQRSALGGAGSGGGNGGGGGGGVYGNDRIGGSFTGSGSQAGDRKKRTGSAASSHELEHRFRAARAAAVGVNMPAPDRSPSMRSKQGSARAYGTLGGGSGASVMSGGTHGAVPGGGRGGDASSASSANYLYSDSKSMISRVSTAASATASGLFGADYAQKGVPEIQAEIKVVEEEGMRMLENFVGLERATLGKADLSPELMDRIQEARSLRISQGDGAGTGSNAGTPATLRRTTSLGSAGGWMNTIRAASSRDRRRSGTSDGTGSGSIFSAFTFGRGKKDKDSSVLSARPGNHNNSNSNHSTLRGELDQNDDTLMSSSQSNASDRMSRAADSAAKNADGQATIRSARRHLDGSRAGSLTGRSGYPPPSASAIKARGLAPPPPSAYRLSGSSGRGHSQQGSSSGNGHSRSDQGHSSMAGGGGGGNGSQAGHGSDAELDDGPQSNTGSTLNPLRRLLGEQAVDELELDPVTAHAAANLVAELDDIDTRKAAVLKRYHDRTSYLHSQLQSARIREKLRSR